MRALITGATGFVGRELASRLVRPVVVSRDPRRARSSLGDVEAHAWAGETEAFPQAALEGVEAIFHLAGEPVAEGRFTDQKKARIRDSRVVGTRRLVDGLAARQDRPRVLVSASAVGWYGNTGDAVVDEQAPAAGDFLGQVCKQWEAEARRAETLGIRVVCLRLGLVLGHGGALEKMLPIFRLGLGGTLARGRHWMPWVHLEDVVRLFLFAAERDSLTGPANAVAPHPVTNAEFTRELGRVLHRPAIVPVPGFALRLLLGEFAGVLLASQRVVPRAALAAGYEFQYPELPAALADAVAPDAAAQER